MLKTSSHLPPLIGLLAMMLVQLESSQLFWLLRLKLSAIKHWQRDKFQWRKWKVVLAGGIPHTKCRTGLSNWNRLEGQLPFPSRWPGAAPIILTDKCARPQLHFSPVLTPFTQLYVPDNQSLRNNCVPLLSWCGLSVQVLVCSNVVSFQ